MDAIKTLIGYVTYNVIFDTSNVPSLFFAVVFNLEVQKRFYFSLSFSLAYLMDVFVLVNLEQKQFSNLNINFELFCFSSKKAHKK